MLSILKKRPVPRGGRVERWTLLELEAGQVDVRVVENPRTSRLTLRIIPASRATESLRVTVPPGTPDAEIDSFLARNATWVASRLEKLPVVTRIAEGAIVPLRGVDHTIRHSGHARGVVATGVSEEGPVIRVHGDKAFIPRKVVDFLKRQSRADLTRAVEYHASNLNVTPKSITLRDTTSRWGSCSTTGALNFSWRIVLAPPEVLDYLAAHEVAHLVEMNHSERFWAQVGKTCPNYEKPKSWLREHGAALHAVQA
jgi:predicted metal-dependent hydrolase